jgi:hypothetical protein
VDAASGAPFINDVLIFHTPIAKTPAKTPAVAPNRKPPPPALAA